MALVQSYFLAFNVDKRFDLFNIVFLDALYSAGYAKMAEGNTVFGMLAYIAFGIAIAAFLFASIMTLRTRRYPYVIAFILFLADALICLLVGANAEFLVHAVLLVGVYFAYRNRTLLNMLNNNVWGYD
jgi:hypothetical protein